MNKLKSLLKKGISLIESSLSVGVKLLIGVLVIGSGVILVNKLNATKPNITASTVMITNIEGNSGGSGVVVNTSLAESSVLTNKHVCEVAKNGGQITMTNGESHLINRLYKSKVHDLCLVVVDTDLKVKAKLASRPPQLYTPALISGHPNLLPNVVSTGHFSGQKVIKLLTGYKECTKEDYASEAGPVCEFFGKLPQFHVYTSSLVTAMVMPGSSGSAVYNSDKELSGLVFAGNSGLSYAFIVPFEYLHNFLTKEVSTLEPEVLDYSTSYRQELEKRQANEERAFVKTIIKKCTETTDTRFQEYCSVIIEDFNWNKNN